MGNACSTDLPDLPDCGPESLGLIDGPTASAPFSSAPAPVDVRGQQRERSEQTGLAPTRAFVQSDSQDGKVQEDLREFAKRKTQDVLNQAGTLPASAGEQCSPQPGALDATSDAGGLDATRDDKQRLRRLAVARRVAAGRLQMRSVARAFESWVLLLAEVERNKALLAAFILAVSPQRRAFVRWAGQAWAAKSTRLEEEALKEEARKEEAREEEARAEGAWQETQRQQADVRSRRLRDATRKAVEQRRQAELRRKQLELEAETARQALVVEEASKRLELMARRAAGMLMRLAVGAAFATWSGAVVQTKRRQAVVAQVVGRLRHLQLDQCFIGLRANAVELISIRIAAAEHTVGTVAQASSSVGNDGKEAEETEAEPMEPSSFTMTQRLVSGVEPAVNLDWHKIAADMNDGAHDCRHEAKVDGQRQSAGDGPESDCVGSTSDVYIAVYTDVLREQLGGMKTSSMRRRAAAAGATVEQLDCAEEGADYRQALIELLGALEFGLEPTTPVTEESSDEAAAPDAGPVVDSSPPTSPLSDPATATATATATASSSSPSMAGKQRSRHLTRRKEAGSPGACCAAAKSAHHAVEVPIFNKYAADGHSSTGPARSGLRAAGPSFALDKAGFRAMAAAEFPAQAWTVRALERFGREQGIDVDRNGISFAEVELFSAKMVRPGTPNPHVSLVCLHELV